MRPKKLDKYADHREKQRSSYLLRRVSHGQNRVIDSDGCRIKGQVLDRPAEGIASQDYDWQTARKKHAVISEQRIIWTG